MILTFLSLVTIVVCAVLGTIVFARNPQATQNKLFGGIMMCFVLWALGAMMMRMVPDSALYWARFACVSVVFLPALFLHFAFSFKEPRIALNIYIPALFFLFLALFTDKLISGVVASSTIEWGIGLYVFIPYLLVYLICAFYYLLQIERDLEKHEKKQMKYFVAGAAIPAIIAPITNILLPLAGINWLTFGEYSAIPAAIIIGYVFLKLR